MKKEDDEVKISDEPCDFPPLLLRVAANEAEDFFLFPFHLLTSLHIAHDLTYIRTRTFVLLFLTLSENTQTLQIPYRQSFET